MNRKLFAFDIDGTLLDSQKKTLDSTREAIWKLQSQGHFITIASGRSRYLITNITRDLDISNYIVCNGAAAFIDHEQMFKNVMDNTALTDMAKTLDEQNVDTAMITMDGIFRSSSNNLGIMSDAMSSFGEDIPDMGAQNISDHEIYQSLAFYSSELDEEVNSSFPQFRFVRWHEQSVDVVPRDGSKAATLMTVADYLGIDRKDVIAFGDGNNDVEMLQAAGVGVAMGNAEPEVQMHADMVTASNDEDGIWQALREMALV